MRRNTAKPSNVDINYIQSNNERLPWNIL